MISPASLFFNSTSAKSPDVVEALRILSDGVNTQALKVVKSGREGDPGIPLDQGTGKT